MTDNEKAATFIGWKPGQRCGGCDARMMDHGFENIDAETGEPFGRAHTIDAPDMSDPRNYMKALEGLSERGWLWFVANHADGKIQMKIWKPAHHPTADQAAQLKPAREVVVVALAALYDAEQSA